MVWLMRLLRKDCLSALQGSLGFPEMQEDNMMMTFSLPPGVNKMYRFNRSTGIMYKTREAKEWEEECLWKLKSRRKSSYSPTDRVLVSILFHFPFPEHGHKKQDIDGGIKATLDMLQRAEIYKNDEQVDHLMVVKEYVKENPRMEVFVEKLQ